MSRQWGYTQVHDLFSRSNPPTALIAAGNLILSGTLQALQELRRVPGRDLALVGCDNTELARLYSPSVTVIGRDLRQLGRTAAELLLTTIGGAAAETVTLPTWLIVRESSRIAEPTPQSR